MIFRILIAAACVALPSLYAAKTLVAGGDPISSFHTIHLPSGALSYTATIGTRPIYNAAGELYGHIGYTAYIADTKESNRPITFAFNGGPGCSSMWLHIFGIAPRRALAPSEGQTVAPPYQIIDNESTLLDLTDIVFIDPMSTGISRTEKEKDPRDTYDSYSDARVLSEFVRDFISDSGRWNSPKYLLGESYGTFRACTMSTCLQLDMGIYLNGLVLISSALDYQSFVFDRDNSLPYFLFLPTYAATAWYHGLTPEGKTLDEVVQEARSFAFNRAAPYYMQPYRYSLQDKQAFWQEVADLTGLKVDVVSEYGGKFDDWIYFTKLFPNRIVSRYDTAIVGDISPSGHAFDPAAAEISGSAQALLNAYFHDELGAKIVYPAYESFSIDINRKWYYRKYWGYPTSVDPLRDSLILNPSMKVYVGNGYYDAATPFAAIEHTIDSLNLPENYKKNIQMEYYEGGHMYYLNLPARKKFKADMVKFYRGSTP